MGDVVTHASITAYVIEQLKPVFGPRIPDDDYSYVELGNFLTDVKQFRDPPAFHRGGPVASKRVREAATAQKGPGAGTVVPADKWSNAMFGSTGGELHGLLPEFLALLAQAFTHQVFDTDGSGSGAPPGGPGVGPVHPIDPFEVERVIRDPRFFDQYWPHDHMDFPPIPLGLYVRHRELPLFRDTPRGLLLYLERYIAYLAEELTRLEFDWATANASPLSETQATLKRRDFLVRLGVLLHAVEDFFFHSNVAEVRQWQVLLRHFSALDPATPKGLVAILNNGMAGTRLPETVRLHRTLYRRLRYPVFVGDDKLSEKDSDDATERLYTGGFYLRDVYHTLGGALEAVERNAPLFGGDPAASKLVLVRLAFSEKARRELVAGGDEALTMQRAAHLEQLKKGEYDAAINARLASGRLSKLAAQRLLDAFELDAKAAPDYAPLPPPGGILVDWLTDIQRERDRSHDGSAGKDFFRVSMTDPGSSNGVSTEDVGTHSLLSKDADEKEPLREDAVALAKHASASVATVLAQRIAYATPVPLSIGIDWLPVLQFFMRFPKHGSRRWEEELLDLLHKSSGRFHQPNVDALADKPKVPYLGPPNLPEVLEQRRAGKLRAELEEYYRKFE